MSLQPNKWSFAWLHTYVTSTHYRGSNIARVAGMLWLVSLMGADFAQGVEPEVITYFSSRSTDASQKKKKDVFFYKQVNRCFYFMLRHIVRIKEWDHEIIYMIISIELSS